MSSSSLLQNELRVLALQSVLSLPIFQFELRLSIFFLAENNYWKSPRDIFGSVVNLNFRTSLPFNIIVAFFSKIYLVFQKNGFHT